MQQNSVQVQSVIYNNEKSSIRKTLLSLANAVRVNEKAKIRVGKVTVFYGDASPKPVFTQAEIEEFRKEISPYLELKYEFFNENTGTSKGHNRMANKAESEYMVVMNPDVVVCPKFFELMLAPFSDESRNVGISEARQTPIEHPKEYDRNTLETTWATGACLLFKTEIYKQIGGFDEDTFFMYCDDVDLSWRFRLLGKKIIYVPNCVVYHAKSLSLDGEWTPTAAEVYYSAEAGLLMAYKWSNNERVKEIYEFFTKSNDANLKKAAAHFDELKKNNKLPKQLDADHKVAQFINNDYSKHRFSM